MLKKAKKNKKGFTLVELIVVIAIMAILAAVLIPTVTNKIDDANLSAALSSMDSAASAINSSYMSNQTKSTVATTYAALVAAESELTSFAAGTIATNGKYSVTITPAAGQVTIALLKSGTACTKDGETPEGGETGYTKVIMLEGYTA